MRILNKTRLTSSPIIIIGMAGAVSLLYSFCTKPKSKPNVIMFVTDDLNDWVGPLGYKQTITPNLDKLSREGVTFSNAHAPGVYSAPSRTAIWTGLHASTTGCYGDHVFHYDYPDIVTLQMAFQQAGYNTYGAGKLYHHRSGYLDLRGWNEYYSRSQQVKDMAWEMNGYHMNDVPLPDPYPYSPYYTETDREGSSALHLEWGPIANEQEKDMVDTKRTKWACEIIQKEQEEPFFLAVGMYSPHYPNYAPQKYFDLYNRDSIQLPAYKEDDLDDLPEAIRKQMLGRSKQHQELEKYGALKDAVQGYLAAISYADSNLGLVLESLERSGKKDNTIIIFWSDQGFHHGEKGHWGKHTLWERTSHVPFIWAGKGIAKNQKVGTTVSLIDIYPTLAEICDLTTVDLLDGVSLASALKNPSMAKERNVLLPYIEENAYSIINMNWRYIHYADSTEELYNVKEDPNEWNNLAEHDKYRPIIHELQQSAPIIFAPEATDRKSLSLVIEGDGFYWKKKE